MDIKFYIPSDETVPTQLRLLANGKIVNYHKVRDKFAYDFTVYHATEEESKEIVDEIVRKMCYQSYDHGAEWRVTNKEVIETFVISDNYTLSCTIRVSFYIKDSY